MGTPHHGSQHANQAEFQAGSSRQPGSLALNAAYIAATTKNYGALRSSTTPIINLIDRPRGRLWPEGFNDLSYDGTIPGIPTLNYKLTLPSGVETSRKLLPDSIYTSQCNKSTIFTYRGSEGIERFFDENENCFYNYPLALAEFERAIGLDQVKDMFIHAAYKKGTSLTNASIAFLRRIFSLNWLNDYVRTVNEEADRDGQDWLITQLATLPIASRDKISPLAVNDSLVPLHSGLFSIPSLESLIDNALSTYENIVLNQVALASRQSPRAIRQYIWEGRRHKELLGFPGDAVSQEDQIYFEALIDNLLYFAALEEQQQLTTLSLQDRTNITNLINASFEKPESCISSGVNIYCSKTEVVSCCAPVVGGSNTVTIAFTTEATSYKKGYSPDWRRTFQYGGRIEKIESEWNWHGYLFQ